MSTTLVIVIGCSLFVGVCVVGVLVFVFPGRLIWRKLPLEQAQQPEQDEEEEPEEEQHDEEITPESVQQKAEALRAHMERVPFPKDISHKPYIQELSCLRKALDHARVGQEEMLPFYQDWLTDLTRQFEQFEWRSRCYRISARSCVKNTLETLRSFEEQYPAGAALPAFQRLSGAINLVRRQVEDGVMPAEQCWGSALSLNWQINQYCFHYKQQHQQQITAEAVQSGRAALTSAEETLKQMQDFAEQYPEEAALLPFQRLYGAVEFMLTIDSVIPAELRQAMALSLNWHWRQWHRSAQRMGQEQAE